MVVLRSYVIDKVKQLVKDGTVVRQLVSPGSGIHIGQGDFHLSSHEEIGILVIDLQIVLADQSFHLKCFVVILRLEGVEGIVNQLLDLGYGEAERMDRALESFQQVDVHQTLDALFTVGLTEKGVTHISSVLFFILLLPAGKNIFRWGIDAQVELGEQLVYFIVVDGSVLLGKRRADGNRFQACWKVSNRGCIVVFLNVFPGAGDGDAVEQFEEVEA